MTFEQMRDAPNLELNGQHNSLFFIVGSVLHTLPINTDSFILSDGIHKVELRRENYQGSGVFHIPIDVIYELMRVSK